MKIGFDISQTAHHGGVSFYTKNLAKSLLNNPGAEMVYFYSSLRKPYEGNLPNVKSYRIPPTIFEILFNRTRILPIETFIGNVDIFHSSDWIQPKTKAKKVTTYHDVVPLKFPEWSTPKVVGVHRRRMKLVENEVDMIIAVSEATKKDLLEVSNIPEEKIKVIYEAAGEQFKPQPEDKVELFRKKFNLPQEFVLAIGGVGTRRNLDRVKESVGNYNLVITGQTLPWVSDEQLPLLYAAAKVLLYPSFYEGFGLPILEAMATGTPVITSNVSSMPEVAEAAALFVDPYSQKEIKDKLRLVMEDKVYREKLIKDGFEQAKKFSWEKCANETIEIYRELIGR
ncbi:glycosyltransferase family 1 protein [Candidatus Parcubacteria bacterium]|nr:MAG: glycosyltransferase family 1 protein [Candidatus Parcubacteria bacterium]